MLAIYCLKQLHAYNYMMIELFKLRNNVLVSVIHTFQLGYYAYIALLSKSYFATCTTTM
jgi:hypothetical protein